MTEVFHQSLWPGLLLWVVLYVSDYFFTIACARMYRAQDKIVFEGSFEITPAFQNDVNALRFVSPRFLLALGVSVALLSTLWWLTRQPPFWTDGYVFALGALILLELTIHVRHLRNWFLFRTAFGPDGVAGRLEYPRGILLRTSAFELLVFAGLFSVLFLLTASWFMLGGVTTCLVTAWKHFRLARKHAASRAPAA